MERQRDWRIVQCDVGQGHATLFERRVRPVLIDTGPDPEALMECLATAHVDRIDALLLTHFDHDHSGAAEAVAGLTSTVVHGPTDADAAEQLHILAQHGVEAVEVEQGQRIDVGPIGIDVLWPPPESDAGNEGSLVLALHADADGVAELIVLGDIGERQQRRLKGSLPPAHAMLAAHHLQPRPGRRSVCRSRSSRRARRGGREHVRPPDPIVPLADRGRGLGSVAHRSARHHRDHGRRHGLVRTPRQLGLTSWLRTPMTRWQEAVPAPIVLLLGKEELLVSRANRRIRDILRMEDEGLDVDDIDAGSYDPGTLALQASPSLFMEPKLLRVSDLDSIRRVSRRRRWR